MAIDLIRQVFRQLSALVAMSTGGQRLDTVIRLTGGRALLLLPLPVEVDLFDGESDAESVVAAFAGQFVTDVTGVSDNQRTCFVTALGDRAVRVSAAVFIADFVPRVWAGSEALGLGHPGRDVPVDWDHETDPAQALLGEFVPAVARLRALDPLTTEVVRLRGAIAHNCRLCKSLRERHALDAGGSESFYAEIGHYEHSDQLSHEHKAALRYVDALVWTTSAIPVEPTLDIMRNATNKIAVAVGADTRRVASGTERYLIDDDGQTVFAGAP